jgi:DNA-binding HxlR family transcriptional regulator
MAKSNRLSQIWQELKRDVLCTSEKMLIQELRHLEGLGVVCRTAHYEIPPEVEYSLTDRGTTLIPLLENIVTWANSDMELIEIHTK